MVVDSCHIMTHDSGVSMSPKGSRSIALSASLSFKEWQMKENELEFTLSFKMGSSDTEYSDSVVLRYSGVESDSTLELAGCQPEKPPSQGLNVELDAAALKLQKVYKSYRTRRNLADCAVVVEELWWKALDFASLNRSSVSFFDDEKSESTVSRWARASTRAAKVGKGLSKDEKAQKLALRHWLEAIDPRHRYGHNLSMYYDIWFNSENTQPFFYWLDIGDGKELSLEKCSRHILQRQTIKYLGPKEREAYEVIVRSGKLIYRMNGQLVNTAEGSKWIFVLSTSRNLYVGKKIKGKFQHSSFLAGAATTAAGRLVAKDGLLTAIWPYSGHYLPTEENFKEFISYLSENNVDLTNVKRNAVDDDSSSFRKSNDSMVIGTEEVSTCAKLQASDKNIIEMKELSKISMDAENSKGDNTVDNIGSPKLEFDNRLHRKWATGAGPRVGCVRDYPADLQVKALEQVSLSPRPQSSPTSNKVPIPSPRPRSTLRLSPGIVTMGIPSPIQSPRFGHFVVPTPRVTLTLPNLKKR